MEINHLKLKDAIFDTEKVQEWLIDNKKEIETKS